MRKIFAIAALGLALLSFGGAPAMAQQDLKSAAVSACSVPPVSTSSCNAALRAYIAVVKTLPSRQADVELADLINILAGSSTPAARAAISAAIVTVSDAIDNPVVKQAALDVSAQVATGQEVTVQIAQLAIASAS